MTTSSAAISVPTTTDAAFRTAGSAFSGVLSAIGLTQTSDTGQVNWSTVTKPGSINTDGGYEIWRLNDSAQSTHPIFLKVRYGVGGAVDRFRVEIDLGEGSNGSGTLTGATITVISMINPSSSSATSTGVGGCWLSTKGILALYTVVSGNVVGNLIMIERWKDTSAAIASRGASFIRACSDQTAANTRSYILTPGSMVGDTTNSIPIMWPGRYSAAASAGGILISPLTPITGNGTHGVMEKTLGLVGGGYAEWNAGETISLTRWDSVSHTYKFIETTGCANMNSATQEANVRHAIIWE